METFWMVIKAMGPGSESTSFRHSDAVRAAKEAERLARQFPGEEFVILESTKFCKVEPTPVKWDDTIELPF